MSKRKIMGSYKDALGRLWRYWRGRWRLVKETKR